MLVQGAKSKVLDFKLMPMILETLDPSKVQSQIPPKVLLANDICNHFKCAIQEISTMEMDDALGKFYVDGTLKPKHQHFEAKGLTHIPHIPQEFQIKWIRYILSQVHNRQLWLEKPILIRKKMIH